MIKERDFLSWSEFRSRHSSVDARVLKALHGCCVSIAVGRVDAEVTLRSNTVARPWITCLVDGRSYPQRRIHGLTLRYPQAADVLRLLPHGFHDVYEGEPLPPAVFLTSSGGRLNTLVRGLIKSGFSVLQTPSVQRGARNGRPVKSYGDKLSRNGERWATDPTVGAMVVSRFSSLERLNRVIDMDP